MPEEAVKTLKLLCYICGKPPKEVYLWSLNAEARNNVFVSCHACLPRMNSEQPFVLKVKPVAMKVVKREGDRRTRREKQFDKDFNVGRI